MLWVCKVSDSGGQRRITLPKGFIKDHGLENAEYMGIDDRDPERITITFKRDLFREDCLWQRGRKRQCPKSRWA